jgi:hypothetical protein
MVGNAVTTPPSDVAQAHVDPNPSRGLRCGLFF